jgi:hypothetical protein
VEQGSKAVSYIIEPRYKYRSFGQKVTYGDVLVLRNIKTDLYIHISDRTCIWDDKPKPEYAAIDFLNVVPSGIDKRYPPDQFIPCFEVNCSSSKSKFTLHPYRNFESEYEPMSVKAGQIVRF